MIGHHGIEMTVVIKQTPMLDAIAQTRVPIFITADLALINLLAEFTLDEVSILHG
jgi:hypothetical protein